MVRAGRLVQIDPGLAVVARHRRIVMSTAVLEITAMGMIARLAEDAQCRVNLLAELQNLAGRGPSTSSASRPRPISAPFAAIT